MDYFTFLGVGKDKVGYEEVLYSYKTHSKRTKFVQEFIYEIHKKDIKRVVVFVTEKSKDKYGKDFEELFNETKLEFCEIDAGISGTDFIEKFEAQIGETKNIIIDLTNIFRSIPMKLLLTLKYIEKNQNINISHMYYGKINEKEKEGILEDIIEDYAFQELASALELFDKTLFLRTDTVSKIFTNDVIIQNLVEKMNNLNSNFETCNLEGSITCCKSVYDACNRVLANNKGYYMSIIPFVTLISKKFEKLATSTSEIEKKIEMFNVLIEHQKLQAAITFIDQSFRKILVEYSINGSVLDYHFYNVSQHLMYSKGYDCREISEKNKVEIDFLKKINRNYEINIDKDIEKTVKNYKKEISVFYDKIRNPVNHGSQIKITNLEKCIKAMICLFEDIKKVKGN